MSAPWWSAADDAGLDVLVDRFLDVFYCHRERCPTCASGPWCEPMRECFAVITDWKRGRELRSKAEWLRARELARREAA